jgi:DNA mismatch endonuclease (patch repair protein)
MRSIKGKNTKPELAVRRALTRLGVRYRIHPKTLPGRPDIAVIGAKKAIFVNGCFWHQHSSVKCFLRKVPRTNLDYWLPKLRRTKERDAENITDLRAAGWKCLIIWECEIHFEKKLERRLQRFLS